MAIKMTLAITHKHLSQLSCFIIRAEAEAGATSLHDACRDSLEHSRQASSNCFHAVTTKHEPTQTQTQTQTQTSKRANN